MPGGRDFVKCSTCSDLLLKPGRDKPVHNQAQQSQLLLEVCLAVLAGFRFFQVRRAFVIVVLL